MNKSQIAKRAIAGLLAGVSIGLSARAIANKTNNNCYEAPEKNISELLELPKGGKIEKEEYKVYTINASIKLNENNEIIGYSVPEGFVLVGNKGYRIEYIMCFSYPAAKSVLENGTIMYYLPQGGILLGARGYISKSSFLTLEETYEYLYQNGYIEAEGKARIKSI